MASRREQYTADKFISLFGELVKRDLRLKYRRSFLEPVEPADDDGGHDGRVFIHVQV